MSKQADGFGCTRCGSFSNWEIHSLLRSWQEGDKTLFAYQAICKKCGRGTEWVSDNPDAVPARVKIREEMLTPDFKFDSTKAQGSDMYGFDLAKVQPRLATGNQ